MTVDEIYQTIATEKPVVIYVSGKTSTGKSTFGRRLRDELGYQVIELEAILLDIVKSRGLDEQSTFRKVLYESGDFEEEKLFLQATDKIIADALATNKPVVIEGAVANADTLARILQPAQSRLFLYFHPSDLEVYIRNLTSRFMESGEDSYGGLPLKFWQLVDDEEFKEFCVSRELSQGLRKTIKDYALASQKESFVRLAEFRQKFGDITVIDV